MSDASTEIVETIDVDRLAEEFYALDAEMQHKALLAAIRARDAYRMLADELMEKVAKLERGLLGPKKQRFKGDDGAQLSLLVLAELLGMQETDGVDAEQLANQLIAEAESEAEAGGGGGGDGDGDDATDDEQVHGREHKPTGRRAAREELLKVSIELLPDEVKRLGTDAFERIGEECSTTIERRRSALVEVTVVRPKFRAKTDPAIEAVKHERVERGLVPEVEPQAWILSAPPPELPIERGMAGPGLLANLIIRRFDDYLPYNRLENVYEREGMRLGRSTLYGWLDALRLLFAPLIEAMRADARAAPYLCIDATGVLVQAPEVCSRGHFWVLVVPGRHVLFSFSHNHDSAAVDDLLAGYDGYVVADAHTVYDHLYADGASEVGCWGHGRAYFFKALGTEPELASEFLSNLRIMFMLERKFAKKSPKQRQRMRASKVRPIVDRHFALCRQHQATALEGTPLFAAIRYSLNQEAALRRFLDDGRLPATNNISERQLRRQATGRKNWLFVGSDDGAEVNTTCSTLVASCHLAGIEPETYLRDLLCLLPDWPKRRVLELAPCNWKQTREQPDTQQRLSSSLFRNLIIELDAVHSAAP
jgi:transposase